MSLSQHYSTAVVQAFNGRPGVGGLLPLALAKACVAVLPVAGAGLSVVSQSLRVPLSASDEAVGRAERLQTTLGDGPCLAAATSAVPVVADLAAMKRWWPNYHTQIVQRTPFRSVASFPLKAATGQFGALDLYSTDPLGSAFADTGAIEVAVATQAAGALMAAPNAVNAMGITIPTWLDSDLASNRLAVWIAVGILVGYASLNDADCLAVLRAYAVSHDLTLDDVAQRMATAQLHPEEVAA